MAKPSFLIKETSHELSEAVAQKLSEYIITLTKQQEKITIAFSGGSTPKLLFQKLSQKKYQNAIPWSKVHIFLVDERWVQLNHQNSNFKMLKENLLDFIDIPEGNIHPMPVVSFSPDKAPNGYETTIEKVFEVSKPETPSFDIIFLGLGDDGHTASIFPGEVSKQLLSSKNWIEVIFIPKLDSYRMTMTISLINNAKNVWFLVTGSKKAEILKRVISGTKNPKILPAQAVRSINPILWCLDNASANELNLDQ
ncbi:MAG: 6-phosphogluconolactonase [Candidatus Hodarchaeales archaeon]|jgi:6-phosphogluconolactonase